MATTCSNSRGLPAPTAAPFHSHAYFHPSPSSTFLEDSQEPSCLRIPSDYSFAAATAQEQSPPTAAARKNKQTRKRPRPSRWPPTTVLTTDASNFRAMVHEFTGFPAPPPFAHPPHLRPGGVLTAAAPSHFNLPAASRASPRIGATSNSTSSYALDAIASFARRNATPAADSDAAVHRPGY